MAELNQFYQLVTIAETGTLSKAAELIHISQPALTRSIQKLEAEWNVALFDRQKNKVSLNKTGELAVQYARRILDDVDNMTRTVQAFERSLRTISIGSCAPAPIVELLAFLPEQYSNMATSAETVSPDLLLPGLEKNIYQIIITDHPVEMPDILCQKLCTEQLFVTIPPAHPLASRKEGIYAEDLAGETMLLSKKIGVWKHFVETKMSHTTFIVQDHDEALAALISASALPAFATDLTMRRSSANLNRSAVPFLDPQARITFYCCVHKSNEAYLPKR